MPNDYDVEPNGKVLWKVNPFKSKWSLSVINHNR